MSRSEDFAGGSEDTDADDFRCVIIFFCSALPTASDLKGFRTGRCMLTSWRIVDGKRCLERLTLRP